MRSTEDSGFAKALLLTAVVTTTVLAGCGTEASKPASVEAEGAPESIGRLSASFDLELVAMPGDVFLLVDGGDQHRGRADSTTIWRVDVDGARELATLDVPLRTPVAWRSGDREVTVVGMNCPTLEDELESPTCSEAPLVAATVDLDGHAETRDLGVDTLGDAGFNAGPLGAEGIAFVTIDPANAAPHAVTVAAPGEEPIDHGPVNARRVCGSPDGTILIPSELSPEANQVLRITTDGVEPVESNGSLDEALARETGGVSLATFTGCSDGQALLRAMTENGVENFGLDGASPDNLIPLKIPAEFAAGEVLIGAQGQFFSWTAGEEGAWELAEERNGAWTVVGEVDSVEAPQLTVSSETTYAALITREGGLMIEIVS